jgi:thiol-disulfide isomerase/thioredoxin
MHILRRPTVLLFVTMLWFSAGCSSTGGLRSGGAPKVRTIASVGDKPLPAEAGEPGATVAADEYTPERRVDPKGRVSGRVFDERGEPVSNARVRLALGGLPGGKVVRTTTDASGGFTLHGLRPGASYTLVAEWNDRELGLLTGRAEAQAPETDVRITVAADEESVPPARASGKVNRVSRPDAGETEEELFDRTEAPESAPHTRTELLPPAPEAEAFLPPAEPRTRRPLRASEAEPPMTARWRPGDTDRAGAGPRGRAAPSRAAAAPDERPYDEGENPLPPALPDDGTAGSAETASANPSNARAEPTRAAAHASRAGTPGSTPETYTPITLAEKPIRTGLPVTALDQPTVPAPRGTQPPPVVPWYDTAKPLEDDAPPRVAHEESSLPDGPRRRTTWGEIMADARPRHQTPERGPEPDPDPVRDPGAEPEKGTARLVAVSGAAARPSAPAGDDGTVAYCRFDAKSRRIVDFRLPDLNGKPVRFQELDSDLVLIDFWGTWCKPCLSAVPHLVDLQNRLGGKRLTIVGIASEQGSPAARTAAVASAVKKLGINYPVLLSGMDGPSCPVQEALHVQAFPTLILVDRQGRILWRDQGATPATLGRLDHFIAAAIKTDDTRRY